MVRRFYDIIGTIRFIAPIHRVKHWNPTTKRRNKCWAKEGECVFCKNGTPKINEFTYGVYISEQKQIKYLTLTVASHTQAQRLFSTIIDNGMNPTDLVFEFKKVKSKHLLGGKPMAIKSIQLRLKPLLLRSSDLV
ncbi:MAG: hypothetical protein CM15mV52_0350 [uncultured marine virus]|nr:MAG: hypothetical protein CM15mV52_0350 [uncultured marine virus]